MISQVTVKVTFKGAVIATEQSWRPRAESEAAVRKCKLYVAG